MARARETTHFGDREVALEDKQGLVNAVFDRVARRYDLMNDLMSFGVHRLWKDALVAMLSPPRMGRPLKVLDMAGGTGDVAQRIIEAAHGNAEVIVADVNRDMLAVGAERAAGWRHPGAVRFVEANAEALAFDDDSFDAFTIAFGIRNVPRIEAALGEAFRVLRRGGRFLCLEFSKPDVPVLDRLYQLYCERAIPPLGRAVTGSTEPYTYLVESIRQFPGPAVFASMIGVAGFARVTHTPLSGNIAAIHSGWKL
ncbi:MAG: bifunctional demethylmenaquinone methyltransferase/2-methoxy-6-polyprenyl-1,4-benzoquinol methylase UbiE [Cucumibacter sp.]